ncbi:MAG: ammonium transporter [Clostridia bacterium]|nr:ammonium transporter [Clostridia bacterium]
MDNLVSVLGADAASAIESFQLGLWFLIGAALVFFMQCGFAMVETGFTRAKNAGNIIMKNLMDFCIGTVVFVFLGFGLMMSEDYIMGFIGIPNMQIFDDFAGFVSSGKASSFVFNLVFCATAATIVSGSMAERTKFSAYCIYSAVISAVVYPIEAGWIWNTQGWLYQLGFTDFAGSCAIHMVGGITALIGAIFVGPRIGKYAKNSKGEVVSNAIPGHSLTIGALGCFILWFGWYGFNGAAAGSIADLSAIFLTTTIAPAAATCSCMVYTWWKNGKPDVSMCLNASLAGLVAITAGCAYVDAMGSLIIGLVAGVIVVVSVEFIDNKLKIDDPVGAVSVHGVNGIWGTIAVGLFDTKLGVFTAGKFDLLMVQILGVAAVAAYTIICMTVVFFCIRKFMGIRVEKEDEIAGLDISEHGLASAYADFLLTANPHTMEEEFELDMDGLVPVVLDKSITNGQGKFTKITIICNEEKFGVLKDAMTVIGVTGMTVNNVVGCGVQHGKTGNYRGVRMSMNLLPKVRVEIVVSTVDPGLVVAAAQRALYTGNVGDGKIFVSPIEDVMRVRTSEMGVDALDDDKYK